MDSLNGNSYVDEKQSNIGRGRPIKMWKLSNFAFEKIFALVTPEQTSFVPNIHGLKGRGRIRILPLVVKKEHEKEGLKYRETILLSPQEIINLVEQKIGARNTNRLLKSLTSNQGIKYGGYAVDCEGVTKTRRWGRHPKKEIELTNTGLMKLLADQNELQHSLRALIIDSRQDDARVHALEERALKGEQAAYDELIQVLSSDASKYARQYTASSLGRLGDTRAIESLIKAMICDKYSGVRSVAVSSLEHFGYRQELTLALNDSESSVRRNVANVLGKIRDIRAVEQLAEVLHDSDIDVQCAAANALGEIGDSMAVDSLILMLDCENESARCAAAVALGNFGDRQSIQALRKACGDPIERVRDCARKSIEKMERI